MGTAHGNNGKALIGGLVVAGLIGLAIITNPLAIGAVGGFLANKKFQDELALEAYESVYKTSCPIYRDATTYQRWFDPKITKRAWCEDYLDRL